MSAGAVTVVDYDVGNLLSIRRAFEQVGARVTMADTPQSIDAAERLVLPGVGAFGAAIEALRRRNLHDAVISVARDGRPFLGICLGMQLMMSESEEFGFHSGLDLIPGAVKAISRDGVNGHARKIPHIGWNSLLAPSETAWSGTLLDGTPEGTPMYFVHSFAAAPTSRDDVLAWTEYDGLRIPAVIRRDNMIGFQCHPEKSGPAGLAVFAAFVRS